MIGEHFNFEDVFFRDLTVCVLDTLEGQIRWVNRFSKGDVYVQVPIYYSLSGDERFLLDTFQDDIVSESRFVELNTDLIPRGHLTMTGFNIRSDEFANPNVWLRMVVENEVEIRKVLAKVRAVPISVSYELTIKLASEIDTFKCSQAIMDTLWLYKFMYFEYNFMNIDAVILMPDNNQIQMSREKNLTSDNNIELKASFEVQTYYPAFRKDRVNAAGYPRIDEGEGMTDLNGYHINSEIGKYFEPQRTFPGSPVPPFFTYPNRPWDPLDFPPGLLYPYGPGNPNPPIGATSIDGLPIDRIDETGYPGGSNPLDPLNVNGRPPYGSRGPTGNDNSFGNGGPEGQNQDYFIYAPKRTRWFSNILKARQQAQNNLRNPFGSRSGRDGSSGPPRDPNA